MELGYWLINTPGIGGLIVVLVIISLLLIYSRTLYWIHQGGQADEPGSDHAPH